MRNFLPMLGLICMLVGCSGGDDDKTTRTTETTETRVVESTDTDHATPPTSHETARPAEFVWLISPDTGYPLEFVQLWGSDTMCLASLCIGYESATQEELTSEQILAMNLCVVPHVKRASYDAWLKDPDPRAWLDAVRQNGYDMATHLDELLQANKPPTSSVDHAPPAPHGA